MTEAQQALENDLVQLRASQTVLAAGPASRPSPDGEPAADLDERLARDLEKLQQTREEMLQKMTPAHPAIRDLDHLIAEAQQALRQHEDRQSRPARDAATREVGAAGRHASLVGVAPQRIGAVSDRTAQLWAALHGYDAAVQAERRTWQAVQAAEWLADFHLHQQVRRHSRRELESATALGLGVLAAVIGGGLVAGCRRIDRRREAAVAEEPIVPRRVGSPAVAVPLPSTRSCTRWLHTAALVVLCGWAAWLLLLAVCDGALAARLAIPWK